MCAGTGATTVGATTPDRLAVSTRSRRQPDSARQGPAHPDDVDAHSYQLLDEGPAVMLRPFHLPVVRGPNRVLHRLQARNPDEAERSATPLEILYDLTYVIAFSTAAEQFAEHLIGQRWIESVGTYSFAVFAITWAWTNFTWFSSSFDDDGVGLRASAITQMVGVLVLAFGISEAFAQTARGGGPNEMTMVVGYIVMRLPIALLFFRAARTNPAHRRVAIGYGISIPAAQLGWLLTTVVPLPTPPTVMLLVALAATELVTPAVLEARCGSLPWNPGHLAERFGLLTIIVIGEVVASTTSVVQRLTAASGWSVGAVVIVSSGIVLAARACPTRSATRYARSYERGWVGFDAGGS
jgi:low temperature requirement protein LtrA